MTDGFKSKEAIFRLRFFPWEGKYRRSGGEVCGAGYLQETEGISSDEPRRVTEPVEDTKSLTSRGCYQGPSGQSIIEATDICLNVSGEGMVGTAFSTRRAIRW